MPIVPLLLFSVTVALTRLIINCPCCSILGACTTFSIVFYKTSYERNMSTSLIILMGSTKITFVSYTYSFNMYYIHLLFVTGIRPVKSVYVFSVLVFAWSIGANTQFLFFSLWGKKSDYSSSAS